MSQKVNTLALRAKIRKGWCSLLSTTSHNYIQVLALDIELREYINKLTTSLSAYDAKTIIKGTDNSLRPFSKWLMTKTIDDLDIVTKSNNQAETRLQKDVNQLIKQESNVNYYSPYAHLCSFDFNIWQQPTSINGKIFKQKKLVAWELLESQAMCDYFSEQLATPFNQKSLSYKTSLINGIATTVVEALNCWQNRDGNIIQGIRVICSGKWQKTRDGRTQKIVVSFGSIKRQSLYSAISYGSTAAVTKFGVCNIKVWICYSNKYI